MPGIGRVGIAESLEPRRQLAGRFGFIRVVGVLSRFCAACTTSRIINLRFLLVYLAFCAVYLVHFNYCCVHVSAS